MTWSISYLDILIEFWCARSEKCNPEQMKVVKEIQLPMKNAVLDLNKANINDASPRYDFTRDTYLEPLD